MELGIGPAAGGWQAVTPLWGPGPGAGSWRQLLPLHTCVPTWLEGGLWVPWSMAPLPLPPSSARPRGGALLSVPFVLCALCFHLSEPRLPPSSAGLPVRLVSAPLPLPVLASLPTPAPLVFISFSLHLSFFFPPFSTPEPSSSPLFLCPSGLCLEISLWLPIPLRVLAWSACPCVPRSLCVGGDGGVSREEAVGFCTPAAGRLPW